MGPYTINKNSLYKWFMSILPSRLAALQSTRTFIMILVGGLLLAPLTSILPMLGWDWYSFFNSGNAEYNMYCARSAYPPFAIRILELFTWMNWRDSLAILHSITLVAIALGTWKVGGRYGSIFLALLSAPVIILLWIGHPDGLALFGVVTGFFPLTLLKPQITGWTILYNKKMLFWSLFFLLCTFFIWPLWFLNLQLATLTHEAAFGWVVTGWPVAIIGILMLVGAGDDPYRLMAAGTLLSPYLMPYHLAVLTPAIGKVKGYRKVLLWFSSWFVLLGTGLGGYFLYLNLIFPILVYLFNHSFPGYLQCISKLRKEVQNIILFCSQFTRKNSLLRPENEI